MAAHVSIAALAPRAAASAGTAGDEACKGGESRAADSAVDAAWLESNDACTLNPGARAFSEEEERPCSAASASTPVQVASSLM